MIQSLTLKPYKGGYTQNNDSYEFSGFIRNDMALREDKYYIVVTLRGLGLKPEGDKFYFALDNKEEISSFDIREVDRF